MMAPEKMDPFSTSGTLGRDALIDLVKGQLDNESRDEDFRRDVFLCLAVTIPSKQQATVKNALGSLLARARISGSSRDFASGDDPHDLDVRPGLDDDGVPAELERRIGVISTVLVLGC